MGRGLGRLQKAILAIAHERHGRSPLDYVSAREILIAHYGFPTNGKPVSKRASPAFDRGAVGLGRYLTASVAVAQCFNRLAARGLVERRPRRGVSLTGAGVKRARAMNINTHTNDIICP
jgi:hypothetical protein